MKNKILPIATIIIAILAVIILIFVPKGNQKEENSNAGVANTTVTRNTKAVDKSKKMNATLTENGDIQINADDLEIENLTFIKYDNTKVELVAIKNSSDDIDVAFNTCQSCNGSPKAYFIQKGNELQCQNCGFTFSFDAIGKSSDGCNPITISDENITKTDTGIIISKEFLVENSSLFENVVEH